MCNIIHKRVFSSLNTFNEHRYFEQNYNEQSLVHFKNERIGLTIYDDCCGSKLHTNSAQQTINPIADLAKAEATLILNLVVDSGHVGSYLPSRCCPLWAIPGKLSMRNQLMQKYANDYGIPIIYVNRVVVEGSIIFDGGSSLVHPDGSWQYGELFEEVIIFVNTKGAGKAWPPELRESLWLREAPWSSHKGKF